MHARSRGRGFLLHKNTSTYLVSWAAAMSAELAMAKADTRLKDCRWSEVRGQEPDQLDPTGFRDTY